VLHFYQTKRGHIPEDGIHSHRHENIESEIYSVFVFMLNYVENYIEKHAFIYGAGLLLK
jgi:hypothetical protein